MTTSNKPLHGQVQVEFGRPGADNIAPLEPPSTIPGCRHVSEVLRSLLPKLFTEIDTEQKDAA
jgi:hypothetical protein